MDREQSYCFARANKGAGILHSQPFGPSKFPTSPLDTQDLDSTWGESCPGSVWDKAQRIEGFCSWGKHFGVDGFVR